jgi:acetylornithine/succinyldiaminopimelate/putrescine aminotransferase
VVGAAEQQLRQLMHTSVTVHHGATSSWPSGSARLCPFLDEPQVFFCNTGAEASRVAVKLARRTTGRPG